MTTVEKDFQILIKLNSINIYTNIKGKVLDCFGVDTNGISAVFKLSANIFNLTYQRWLKHIWTMATWKPCYLEGILFISHNWKQDVYPNSNRLWAQGSKTFFDDKESKYESWEVKFLGYLRIQHLHQIILSSTDQSDMDFVERMLLSSPSSFSIWTIWVCH